MVDTPSMLFRAFYALPDSIVGPEGKPAAAARGLDMNRLAERLEAQRQSA
ncbi:MAG TPA: hypothetical protein VFC52_07915 [Solirubrobacterales bacterium]|nr:hypothetical protein [Solirubrobacterales bacterium]